MRVVGVPSGIGDFSWMYSKLMHIGEPLEIEIAEGWPYRTLEYVELLPGVHKVTYAADFRYDDIMGFEQAFGFHRKGVTWESIKKNVPEGRILLEANKHLERGLSLEEWLPDLPCDFHYPIHTKPHHIDRALDILEGMERPITAVSCASYRGAQAWKSWGYHDWSPFLKWWLDEQVGGSILLVGGGWDDLTDSMAVDGHKSVVGKTHIGTCVELLRSADYYIGFSSGLNVIRTVLGKNAFALWPEHQMALSRSWVPPSMIDKEYGSCMWNHREVVQRHVELWRRRF